MSYITMSPWVPCPTYGCAHQKGHPGACLVPHASEVAALRAERDALAARLAEAVGVVRHLMYRNHAYHPAGCSDCERAARVLAAGEGH